LLLIPLVLTRKPSGLLPGLLAGLLAWTPAGSAARSSTARPRAPGAATLATLGSAATLTFLSEAERDA
jgi:hypothetical protein